MKNYFIKKSKLSGEIVIPPSKSQTMRAILFASLAKGKSQINNFLKSPDILAMIEGCEKFKAKVNIKKNNLEIIGSNNKVLLYKKNNKLDVKNSGIALRFLTSIYALGVSSVQITGDESICSNRSMHELICSLNKLGGDIKSTAKEGFAPLNILGPIKSGKVKINGEDSQFVSSLLIALSFLDGKTYLEVDTPGEKPFVQMTLDWMDKLGISVKSENYEKYVIEGSAKIKGFNYFVPTDFSSILFPIVAALITKSEITIKNVIFDKSQKDFFVIDILKEFNAQIEIDEENHRIIVKKSDLKGFKIIDVNDFIDSFPILAVFGCFVDGLTIKNALVAKKKESNRLFAISNELKKMNGNIKLLDDGLEIKKSTLKSSTVNSFKDHRIAMALSIAAMTIEEASSIEDTQCIEKSYPDFKKDFIKLGALIL